MDTNTYNCTIIDTYTEIHTMIVAACVLTLIHLAKDCFKDIRWFVVIIVTLCDIIRDITGTCTTCGDITTTKSGCKVLSGCDVAGSVCTNSNHIYLSRGTCTSSITRWREDMGWPAEQIIDAGPKRVSSLSAFPITETKEGGMMIITTTRITQMHDIMKTLQDGPESVKEILRSEGPWLGEELEKAWKIYYEVQGYLPFATCGNDQCRSQDLCVLTSAALPSTSFSSPLHAPFIPSTPGSQVPGVDSPCLPLHQVQGGVFPSRGASKTQASLSQATVEQNRRELVAFCQQCWQLTNFRHNKAR